uniref:Suppressor of tumorigenicity 7 protein n=1 Tax=Sus scrofa TaxID=9823 RepID=A0A8D0MCL2_PIG
MAEAGTGFLEQLKSCIVWSWTYLWTVWFFIVLFLVYILRVPLKINDNLSTGTIRVRDDVSGYQRECQKDKRRERKSGMCDGFKWSVSPRLFPFSSPP